MDLPGISQIELTAALLEAGVKISGGSVRSSSITESDAAEEAELWSVLNSSEGGKQNFDPFVKLLVKWNAN